MFEGSRPEGKDIDAAIALAGDGVLRPAQAGGPPPGQFIGSFRAFQHAQDLIGDLLVDVEAAHGNSAGKREAGFAAPSLRAARRFRRGSRRIQKMAPPTRSEVQEDQALAGCFGTARVTRRFRRCAGSVESAASVCAGAAFAALRGFASCASCSSISPSTN